MPRKPVKSLLGFVQSPSEHAAVIVRLVFFLQLVNDFPQALDNAKEDGLVPQAQRLAIRVQKSIDG